MATHARETRTTAPRDFGFISFAARNAINKDNCYQEAFD
jgi:hypothetical protein